jgi:hypothetical protein
MTTQKIEIEYQIMEIIQYLDTLPFDSIARVQVEKELDELQAIWKTL